MVTSAHIKSYILKALAPYWTKGGEAISSLPVLQVLPNETLYPTSQNLLKIKMPDWLPEPFREPIPVPKNAIINTSSSTWEQVDWYYVAFWYLNALAEQRFEQSSAPIHSFSFKLKGWDQSVWQRAWVNRIAILLRFWAAKESDSAVDDCCGPMPRYKVHLTHDVDAVNKTWAIRLKAIAFDIINICRSMLRRDSAEFKNRCKHILSFALSKDDYWCFDKITALEKKRNLRSTFNFYVRTNRLRSPLKWVFDPGYRVDNLRVKEEINELHERGWQIGLHQSFKSWNNSTLMKAEKQKLEDMLGSEVTSGRQHWLKFSFSQTWYTQQAVGMKTDMTLAFNDRFGFRNGAAIKFTPWINNNTQPMTILAIPTLFMDSHFYDYNQLSENEMQKQIKACIDEVKLVGGEVAIIWHQRVFAKDYGWLQGYEHVLNAIQE